MNLKYATAHKFLLLAFFILHFTFNLRLQAEDTIIDSVYADSVLDGYIFYSQDAHGFEVNNWMYEIGAGDIGDHGYEPESDNNSYFRSYLSFDLPLVPNGFEIDSVYVRLYQYRSEGNTGWWQTDPQDFPVWDVPGGDTIKCMMSHIDYGNSLDVGDWEKGDEGNPYTFTHNIGTITESGEEGYRYLNLTASVIQDYENERDKTQYRIAFDGIDTDWDNLYDNVGFKSANSWVEWNRPQLFFFFKDNVGTHEDIIDLPDLALSNYPNPFNPTTTISYQLPKSGKVKLQIFNIKGQLIETIVDECQAAGKYTVGWNAVNQSSGIYFYNISAGTTTNTGRCLLLK